MVAQQLRSKAILLITKLQPNHPHGIDMSIVVDTGIGVASQHVHAAALFSSKFALDREAVVARTVVSSSYIHYYYNSKKPVSNSNIFNNNIPFCVRFNSPKKSC